MTYVVIWTRPALQQFLDPWTSATDPDAVAAAATRIDFDGLCSADLYPVNSFLSVNYLHRWMSSSEFTHHASGSQTCTVLPKINQEALNRLPVPVAPLSEQQFVTTRIEKCLAQIEIESRILEECSNELSALEHSILAKAFRGELVPQDPADEPASVLLEQLRASQAGASENDTPRRKARK